MNFICRNLVHNRNTHVKLQTRAEALRTIEGWSLTDRKMRKDQGSFDRLVANSSLLEPAVLINFNGGEKMESNSRVGNVEYYCKMR